MYRYVSDGRLTAGMRRGVLAPARSPWRWGALVVLCVTGGVAAVCYTYARVLEENGFDPLDPVGIPAHLGELAFSGTVWGLLLSLVAAALVLPFVPLGLRVQGRRVARMLPAGTVVEAELGETELLVRGASDTRAIPYGVIHDLRARGAFLEVRLRGAGALTRLPVDLLPDEAVEAVRAATGTTSTPGPEAEPATRSWVVPDGWAGHVASAVTAAGLRGAAWWVKVGVVTVVALLVAALVDPRWLLAVPVAMLLSIALGYVVVRRRVAAVLPVGSVATVRVSSDSFVLRTSAGTRAIRFTSVAAIRFLGARRDVVLLRLRPADGLLVARALLPDELLERLGDPPVPA